MLTHTLVAYNTAYASENKIHDDGIARAYGFTGGLVPGVEVLAYAANPALTCFGRGWLSSGSLEMRFLKPVYDGRPTTVTGSMSGTAPASLDIIVTSDGETRAIGRAAPEVKKTVPPASPRRDPPARAARPPADEESLAVETILSSLPLRVDDAVSDTYIADIRETATLYRESGVIHPGLLARRCNAALVDNVVLPPWIHVSSKVHFLAEGRIGDSIAAHGRVRDNYERKGHRFVDLDLQVVTDRGIVLAQVSHTAIYRLRAAT